MFNSGTRIFENSTRSWFIAAVAIASSVSALEQWIGRQPARSTIDFSFDTSSLQSLPFNDYFDPAHKAVWLSWGEPNDVTEDFTISRNRGRWWVQTMTSRLSEITRLQAVLAAVSDETLPISTNVGSFEASKFVVRTNFIEKYCIDFRGTIANDDHVEGWHCAARGAIPTVEGIKCLIDTYAPAPAKPARSACSHDLRNRRPGSTTSEDG